MKKTIALFMVLMAMAVMAQATLYDLYLRTGDNEPYYYAQIKDSAGNVVSLAGATVTFSMLDASGTTTTPKVDKQSMVVTNATQGLIEYQWQAGNTDTAGTYYLQVSVTKSGKTYTLPANRQDKIIIRDWFE